MQFVEGFVVLSWSVSLWAKILWEFYPRMYGLYPFIQKMSRVSPLVRTPENSADESTIGHFLNEGIRTIHFRYTSRHIHLQNLTENAIGTQKILKG